MEEHEKGIHDFRIVVYRTIKQLVIIVICAVIIKSLFIDSILISGNQMSPTIVKGDQTLIFKFPFLQLIQEKIKPGLSTPVVFKKPFEKNKMACLRIAGTWGDTVSVDSGIFVNFRNSKLKFIRKDKNAMVVPASYSPRDYFKEFRVPLRGDHLKLDSLSLRDFFFTVAVIRQENTNSKVSVKADLYIKDTISNDYFIKEFSLYKGTLDTVPVKYQFDWFFWDRLDNYLNSTVNDYSTKMKFTVYLNNQKLTDYIIKKKYVFMLADNWSDGLDSRYIGPVQVKSLVGQVFFVLWSGNKDFSAWKNIKRIGRIIR
jgi:signal peptidase I